MLLPAFISVTRAEPWRLCLNILSYQNVSRFQKWVKVTVTLLFISSSGLTSHSSQCLAATRVGKKLAWLLIYCMAVSSDKCEQKYSFSPRRRQQFLLNKNLAPF